MDIHGCKTNSKHDSEHRLAENTGRRLLSRAETVEEDREKRIEQRGERGESGEGREYGGHRKAQSTDHRVQN
jgi:hypothetical protein